MTMDCPSSVTELRMNESISADALESRLPLWARLRIPGRAC